jgi:sulfotransferase
MEQMVFLSGLPRTGSTLLSAILCQNPKIHAEGNSAVCQLMWDLKQSCFTLSNEQLRANNREQTIHDLVSSVPKIYYKDINETIVVDKCRSWSLSINIEIIQKYICANFKMIILERPVIDIVKSFAKLYDNNNWNRNWEENILKPGSEPIMRSIMGVNYAKQFIQLNPNSNNFLFISYDELINNTEKTIQKIYEFCGWSYFEHDFKNIVIKYPENDEVYNVKGHHEIRPVVKKQINNIKISQKLEEQCNIIDKLMGYII